MSNIQSWTIDAPSGVYKNHALSQLVLEAVIADVQFMPYVEIVPGYGKGKGESVTVPRFSNISPAVEGRIGEFDDIPEDIVAQSTKTITVSEWARGIPFTQFNADLSPLDLPMYLRNALQKEMKLILDRECADAFKETLTKYVPTAAAAGTFYTNGTAGTAALVNLNFYHIERLRDYAMETIHMARGENDMYNLMAATKACRGIKLDPKFEQWNVYTNRDAKVRGEIGQIEGVRVIEVNNSGSSSSGAALRNDLGTGSVLGEAIFFGQDPVLMAVAKQPEVMVYKASFDSRKHMLAFHGIFEFAPRWAGDSASDGEADIIHVTSA